MGAFLEKPKTDKTVFTGADNELRWGVSAMQGWRMEMEDAHTCETRLKLKGWSFFAVFDGHAGPKVSEYCSQNLLGTIMQKVDEKKDDEEAVSKKMKEGFFDIDAKLLRDSAEERGGTTVISCMVSPDKFIWANCGDSRGLLCRKGKLEFSTIDHKPMNEQERKRIEKAGGTVMMQRVNGSLAVSRALGDFAYKSMEEKKPYEQLVSPEPEMHIMDRSPDDQFLLLACDGIFDVMKNEEIIQYVLHHLEIEESLSKICSDLIDMCLNKNSRDNMSAILVTFPGAPTVSEKAIEADKKENKEQRIEIVRVLKRLTNEANDPLDLEENHVIQQISTELSSRFPELFSDRSFISNEIKERKEKRFGKDAHNFSTSDATYKIPPQEFEQTSNTPVDLGMSSPNTTSSSTSPTPMDTSDPLPPKDHSMTATPPTSSHSSSSASAKTDNPHTKPSKNEHVQQT